ncbi:hypothetical protein EVAR_21940_1 [Eumeta japonica]|uniref:PiggyBac transposable element-derived protein domain-containing protein n=1 Tax=Eumeta variegata TaxID=151549 RepID=A0A4C1XGM4_EUMVA|nr:hypothetical protein EVAR_21940_1 [Eumeta japonica]
MDAAQVERLGRSYFSITCSALSLARSAHVERDNDSCFFTRRSPNLGYEISKENITHSIIDKFLRLDDSDDPPQIQSLKEVFREARSSVLGEDCDSRVCISLFLWILDIKIWLMKLKNFESVQENFLEIMAKVNFEETTAAVTKNTREKDLDYPKNWVHIKSSTFSSFTTFHRRYASHNTTAVSESMFATDWIPSSVETRYLDGIDRILERVHSRVKHLIWTGSYKVTPDKTLKFIGRDKIVVIWRHIDESKMVKFLGYCWKQVMKRLWSPTAKLKILLQDDVQSDGEDCEHQSLRGKDGHRWTATKGRTCSRVSACNIIRTSKGPTRMNKCFYDPIECFSIFITDDIVEKITKWTNAEIQLKMQLRPDVKATFKPTICEEIRALLGILTLTAAMKDNHLTTDELFDCSYSGNSYVAAMSRDRFDFLIRCFRMDDKTLRPELRTCRTSMFCYDGPLTLASYKPKPSKMVYVLSSCDEEDGSSDDEKPNMIHFYNETSG